MRWCRLLLLRHRGRRRRRRLHRRHEQMRQSVDEREPPLLRQPCEIQAPSLPSLRPPKLPVPHPAREHHRTLPLLFPCSGKFIAQLAYAISTILTSMRARERAAQKPYNEPVGTRAQHACEQDQRVFRREPRVGLQKWRDARRWHGGVFYLFRGAGRPGGALGWRGSIGARLG